MKTETVGRVLVHVKVENLDDLMEVSKGQRGDTEVRPIEVDDALVDTGAAMLSLPKPMIEQLGLKRVRTRRARTAAGPQDFTICEPVRLTIQDRDCVIEVVELPADRPLLVGQIPLAMLDFVVDVPRHRLIGNPEHGGEHMVDLFRSLCSDHGAAGTGCCTFPPGCSDSLSDRM